MFQHFSAVSFYFWLSSKHARDAAFQRRIAHNDNNNSGPSSLLLCRGGVMSWLSSGVSAAVAPRPVTLDVLFKSEPKSAADGVS